ncbi:MAG: OmpA family protein [Thermodesulfovibrionia bacterium]|nr:OmpA family protein [Thermodesulfovibrionia bacterium]
MKAGKREDRLFYIIQTVSLLPLYNASFFWHKEMSYGFLKRAGKATVKRNYIKGGCTMKAMYRAALIVAAFVFLLPLSARSEIKAGSFEVSPFVGYNFFESKQNLKDSPEFGGRLGYNFTKNFGIEGVVEFMKSRVDDKSITGTKEGQFRSPMDKVRLSLYHVDAIYHIMPDGNFNPFLVAGFGGVHYNPKMSDHDMAAFNFGIGAKLWMTDNIALRFDVRDYLVTEIFQESYNNIAATVGITFAFGGREKPVPVKTEKYEKKPETKVEKKAETKTETKVEKPVVILVSEPKAEEKVIAVASEPKIEEKIIVLALEDIHFDFDKSTLTKEAQVILKRNLQLLKENPKANIRIAGYTSASGTEEYNQKLSERRANAVKDYLINENVTTPDRLSEIGYGEASPEKYEAAPKDLYSKAAKANMRVLFEITIK